MISNMEDCPDHANGPVLDALFKLAAQRPQLLVDRGEIGTSLVVIQFVIAADSLADDVPCLPIDQFTSTQGLLSILERLKELIRCLAVNGHLERRSSEKPWRSCAG